jgi:molybdate transport system regulatory protein
MANTSTKRTVARGKKFQLQPRLRIRFSEAVAFGPGKADLLELILQTGSIRQAAQKMEMSYMRAWSLVREMNRHFREPVIVAERGGRNRGGTQLTATGRRIIGLYRRMEQSSLKAAGPDWNKMQKLLRG